MIYVPTGYRPTPREMIGRDLRFLCRCASFALAGAAVGTALKVFGFGVTAAAFIVAGLGG